MIWRLSAGLSTPLLPLWAGLSAVHPRLRGDWRERWGLSVAQVAPGVIWVHAASLGEVGAAEALVRALPGEVLLTVDTDTGAALARRLFAGSRVAVAVRPVDHPWTLAPLWAQARPRALVFVENTWWPQLARRAAEHGAPAVRVSVRVRQGTAPRPYLLRVGGAALHITQGRADAARLRAMGLEAVVGGDLKGDRPLPPSPLRWSRPFVVGASTREGDEGALLEALSALPPGTALLLAPRHRERWERVAALIQASGRPWARRSRLSGAQVPDEVEVLLLDSLGELAGCLRGAGAAFIGGTFDPALGGHSPSEAGRAGVPVVVGPHATANAEALARLPHRIAASREALGDQLAAALAGPRPAPWTSGAVRHTLEALTPFLGGPPAPEAPPRPWAAPLVGPYRLGAAVDLRVRGHAPHRAGVPVISVGSEDARGPGKTSTVRWWAAALRARGHTAGVALRGYRRQGRGLACSWEGARAAGLGDEGELHRRDGSLVAACGDRRRAVRALEAAGATVILLDDGLGAREVARDLELVVVDAQRRGARGPLPAGERRPLEALARAADGIVAHRGPLSAPIPVVEARRREGPWHLGDRVVPAPEGPVAAFAGVGQPGDFFRALTLGRSRALPDHGVVPAELLRWADGLPLVCTAKDRVRLPPELADLVYWRDVIVEIEGVPEWWLPGVAGR
ncbi:MAG: tetraacyldisaccharide 4'-kinase [Deltaproteobacteria bacterium]|nr:tetraacyldisaccharide 4'-kinase [Deltaproteobacteria bacterium]